MNTGYEIDGGILIKYLGQEQNVCIPDNVIEIGDCAFYGCDTIRTVIFPSGLKRIGRGAFAECMHLREITFSQGLEAISDSVFEHCPELEAVILPDSVRFIGRLAFAKCSSLRTAHLPKGLEVISYGMFMGDVSLTDLALPKMVTRIEDFAFYFCKSLEELELSDLTVDVYPHTLYGCSGLKRGYISGLNLARYGKEECLLFALLFLSSRERYSYWEAQLYEMFIREYPKRMCEKILEANSSEALDGLMRTGILTETEMDDWIEKARRTGAIEFTAKLLQYKQELFSEAEDMWEI